MLVYWSLDGETKPIADRHPRYDVYLKGESEKCSTSLDGGLDAHHDSAHSFTALLQRGLERPTHLDRGLEVCGDSHGACEPLPRGRCALEKASGSCSTRFLVGSWHRGT